MKKRDNKKLPEFEKYSVKERILIACCASFTIAFIFLLYGPIDVYSNNMSEFAFTFSDFIGYVLPAFFGFGAVLGLILFIFNKHLLNALSAFVFSIPIAAFINNLIFSEKVMVSGDIDVLDATEFIIRATVFALTFFVLLFIGLALASKWKNVAVFLCVLLIGMNGASLVSDFFGKDLIHDHSINCDYVLSQKDITTVSDKENIIYILFDRLDNDYVDLVNEKQPGFFDELDGFTYFDSAVAKYSRTFPAVSNMLTGIEYTAQTSASDYLTTAYGQSDFLKDLKANGYKINIYADRYYEYTDAASLLNIADNAEKVTSYKPNKKDIVEYLFKLSLARNFRFYLAKLTYQNTTTGSAAKLSQLECDDGIYVDNDAWLSDLYNENELTADGSNKRFTFIYMHGSHTPYKLDENGDYSDSADAYSQTVGSFKTVKKYLEHLKAIGVYDNSTIIISGDHANPYSDTEPIHTLVDKGVTTAIMIKPRNAKSQPLVRSSAEVSIDNIIPTIIKDANIKTNNQYASSAFDIAEGTQMTRIYYQSVFNLNDRKLMLNKYEIKGNAHDINNWTLLETIKSEYPWY